MWKYIRLVATMAAAICWMADAGSLFGQTLVSSFENSLSSSAGADWGGMWTINPDFTSDRATGRLVRARRASLAHLECGWLSFESRIAPGATSCSA